MLHSVDWKTAVYASYMFSVRYSRIYCKLATYVARAGFVTAAVAVANTENAVTLIVVAVVVLVAAIGVDGDLSIRMINTA